MSIETDADGDAASERGDVEALGRELGEAIADLPAYERFLAAKADVEADETAQEKISEVEQLREEFMMARQLGEASEEDLRTLKTAQQELHELPVMESYLEAQAELTGRLEAVNEAISEPLAVDFGEEAGGCCKDE